MCDECIKNALKALGFDKVLVMKLEVPKGPFKESTWKNDLLTLEDSPYGWLIFYKTDRYYNELRGERVKNSEGITCLGVYKDVDEAEIDYNIWRGRIFKDDSPNELPMYVPTGVSPIEKLIKI
jgi:hypothetical protein